MIETKLPNKIFDFGYKRNGKERFIFFLFYYLSTLLIPSFIFIFYISVNHIEKGSEDFNYFIYLSKFIDFILVFILFVLVLIYKELSKEQYSWYIFLFILLTVLGIDSNFLFTYILISYLTKFDKRE